MTIARYLFDSCSHTAPASGNAGAFHSRCRKRSAFMVQRCSPDTCTLYGLYAARHTLWRNGAFDAPLRPVVSQNIRTQRCRRLCPAVRSFVRLSSWCQAVRRVSGTRTDFGNRKPISFIHLQSSKPHVFARICKKSTANTDTPISAPALYVRSDSSALSAVTTFLRCRKPKQGEQNQKHLCRKTKFLGRNPDVHM